MPSTPATFSVWEILTFTNSQLEQRSKIPFSERELERKKLAHLLQEQETKQSAISPKQS